MPKRHLYSLCLLLSMMSLLVAAPPKSESEGIRFFESQVRPLLVKRCYACHSAKADPVEGGLRLDTRAGWKKGGDTGPALIPGQPTQSRLLTAVLYTDEDLAMPPDAALSAAEVNILRKWIAIGAPDPRSANPRATHTGPIDWTTARQYWAFRPLAPGKAPKVSDTNWPKNPIDRFILARLDREGLAPVERASREKRLRRLSLDVLGLPPAPPLRRSFLSDRRPGAWARLVDHVLALPGYGERWGRHWLDVARYADDQIKNEYYYRELPNAWRYRDWVIRSLNADLGYDRFITYQLAGDLLDEVSSHDGRISVGLLSLGLRYQADGDTPDGIAIARAETLDDRVDTVTRGFLALTVSCARCHDHKFDPIPTADYYSLAGIFDNTDYVDAAPLATTTEIAARNTSLAYVAALAKKLAEAKKAGHQTQTSDLATALAIARATVPPMHALAHSVRDSRSRDIPIALRGNIRKPGPIVPRRFLEVLSRQPRRAYTTGSGRLELARAIANPSNPLTARVIVNRLWMHHFGRGLVVTASNFGSLGGSPSHPRLLDWLATRLIESDWSLKQLHRDILLSSTYQLSTTSTPLHLARDGDNHLLWRMSRRRLDIEAWRDSKLAVSGRLDLRLGGPAEADLLSSDRRTVYGAVRRDDKTGSDALLKLFDFPNPRTSAGGRTTTTVPQQQLFAMNSPFVHRQAKALADRIHSWQLSREQRLIRLFRLVYSRDPSATELRLADGFLEGPSVTTDDVNATSRWTQYCQVLLASNEFLYLP
ncbi:MAG: PSD1 and planctomycete cytochrome C domain-containing protein [Planctomycetaceae bacterium]